MSVIFDKRRTGRSTRMVEAVYNYLVDHPHNHAVVFVVDGHRAFESNFTRRCMEVGHPDPLSLTYRLKAVTMSGYHMESIQWRGQGLRLRRGISGVPASFLVRPENCRVFIDHAAIESLHTPMLEEWCRYDAPDPMREVVAEEDEEIEEPGDVVPVLSDEQLFDGGWRLSPDTLARLGFEYALSELGAMYQRPQVPRQREPRWKKNAPKPAPEAIVAPGQRRLILRRPKE